MPDVELDRSQVPLNEACVACRAVKRKCTHPGTGAACIRCERLKKDDCTFKQQKRGRKRIRPFEGSFNSGGDSAASAPSMSETTVAESIQASQATQDVEAKLTTSYPSPSTYYYLKLGPTSNPPPQHIPHAGLSSHAHDRTAASSNGGSASASTSRLEQVSAPERPPSSSRSTASGSDTYACPGVSPTNVPDDFVEPPVPKPSIPRTLGLALDRLLAHDDPSEGSDTMDIWSFANAFGHKKKAKISAVSEDAGFGMLPPRAKDRGTEVLDVVQVGVIREEQVEELWIHFFDHLNPMISILDPVLHTSRFCRSRSAFLYSAVLTVTAKCVLSEDVYMNCARHLNWLFGKAFEYGTNTLEVIQALAISLQWPHPTPRTLVRRNSYMTRSAIEIRLYTKAPRPLPQDDLQVRLILNRERTWMCLVVADGRVSAQHSLPRLIKPEWLWDAIQWYLENRNRGGLATDTLYCPLVGFYPMSDLHCALMAAIAEEKAPDPSVLACLETTQKNWMQLWAPEDEHSTMLPLSPPIASLCRFLAALTKFQTDEVRLLISLVKAKEMGEPERAQDPSSAPVLDFARCVRSAHSVLLQLVAEVTRIRYPFDSMWIGVASCGIWLASNYPNMRHDQKTQTMDALKQALEATKAFDRGWASLPIYALHLLNQLIRGIEATATPPSEHNSNVEILPAQQSLPNQQPALTVSGADVQANFPASSSNLLSPNIAFEPRFVPINYVPMSAAQPPGWEIPLLAAAANCFDYRVSSTNPGVAAELIPRQMAMDPGLPLPMQPNAYYGPSSRPMGGAVGEDAGWSALPPPQEEQSWYVQMFARLASLGS
ncbi:BQ5605_C010g06058 [Microbotryum silenes-dioicae]|uniref:BQ5605_C010g06058 protein n=1 Tax=Microbotryum silenes-dioicae TaxID=796604 RepID=A0A2X0LTR3_9BASI|nr:BQ5605_C010g06058 [Microbotryum silenes-dioicae]